jgi:hypothetical protein
MLHPAPPDRFLDAVLLDGLSHWPHLILTGAIAASDAASRRQQTSRTMQAPRQLLEG